MKTLPPVVVANYFIETAIEEENLIDLLKVNKLVHLAHGWHLGIKGKALIREEVEAWKYGPVVRIVYDVFKGYSKYTITKQATTRFSKEMKEIGGLADPETIQFLKSIWNYYRDWSDWQLSASAHEEKTPWHETWNDAEKKDPFEAVTLKETIQKYYEGRIRESKKS